MTGVQTCALPICDLGDEFLFKCFRKAGCESLSCHELSSCKVFQKFVVWIDLFCNTTSGYKSSDLILLL